VYSTIGAGDTDRPTGDRYPGRRLSLTPFAARVAFRAAIFVGAASVHYGLGVATALLLSRADRAGDTAPELWRCVPTAAIKKLLHTSRPPPVSRRQ
jgi:hypothetical protein